MSFKPAIASLSLGVSLNLTTFINQISFLIAPDVENIYLQKRLYIRTKTHTQSSEHGFMNSPPNSLQPPPQASPALKSFSKTSPTSPPPSPVAQPRPTTFMQLTKSARCVILSVLKSWDLARSLTARVSFAQLLVRQNYKNYTCGSTWRGS